MADPRVPRIACGSYTVSQLIVGGWQLSAGHRQGAIDEVELFRAFDAMAEVGITTFDCADIYTGVEELLGRYLRRGAAIEVHTKFVPDRGALESIDRRYVERIIDRSLCRLGVQRLDLVQFAWWDYAVPGYVETAQWLVELQRAGKIRQLGVTNFDAARVRELAVAGVPLAANQVQYSLLDRRPADATVAVCRELGIPLLCYGALAGGFLSERYVGAEDAAEWSNRSLTKYRLVIEEFGGWPQFQRLLAVLRQIAEREGVSIPAVAMRWVLDRPQVGAVILGTYHGRHLESNLGAFTFRLDREDRASLEGLLAECPGPAGDVFGLERELDGPHAKIMRRDLNRG